MAATHFSGPVISAGGFQGPVTGATTGNVTGDVTGNLTGAVLATTPVNSTGATLAVAQATHAGRVVTINKADGATVTLPAATGTGSKYSFFVGTTITSSALVFAATGNDIFYGTAIICNDTDASVSGFETAANTNRVSMDGSTTGGIAGDFVEFIDVATDKWFVRVTGSATGSEATPFTNA